MDRWAWISWEGHRRTRELCKSLNIALYEKNIRLPRYIRHPYLLVWTTYVIARRRPKGVIVQNPSVVLAAYAALINKVFRFALVVDAHNYGIAPFSQKLNWLQFIYQFVQRTAELTIVTNEPLASIVRHNGGKAFVLEDKLPCLPGGDRDKLSGRFNVVCISTFGNDEPIEEILKAAELLGNDYAIYITGNWRTRESRLVNPLPSNVVLTGYLPEEDYVRLLRNADAILDLTNLENCLVCGAYESVEVERPIILSDTSVNRTLFCKGAIYTKNNSEDIKDAIVKAAEGIETLTLEVKQLKQELNAGWAIRKNELVTALGELAK